MTPSHTVYTDTLPASGSAAPLPAATATPTTAADSLPQQREMPLCLKRKEEPARRDSFLVMKANIFENQSPATSILSGDTLYVDKGPAEGVAGDPVPYTVAGDNFITSLLIGCFLLAMLSFAQGHNFILRQAKNFFSAPRRDFSDVSETSGEIHFQFFLVVQTCLLLGLFFILLTRDNTLTLLPQYAQLSIYTFIFAAYFVVKAQLYTFVDCVFFSSQKNGQWMKSYLFLISAEGVLLFPAAMVASYFNVSLSTAFIYTFLVIIAIKLLTLYKTTLIFFSPNAVYLQNILYFCALEAVPAAALWGGLMLTNEYLNVIF